MSDLDMKALEASFELWRTERVPLLKPSKAFEWFSADQILKDAALSDDEIEFGLLGEGDDGGVDGMYMFINRNLIRDETKVPDPAITVELHILQAKNEAGFGEFAVQRLEDFARDLLNYSADPESFTYYHSDVRDGIARFRDKYDQVMAMPHTLDIAFHYSTRSIEPLNPKVEKRVESLKELVKAKLSSSTVHFEYWGCKRLLARVRQQPQADLVVEIVHSLATPDGSAICLVRLNKFAGLLTDERGNLRTSILEPNVRDYAGKNEVNDAISETLADIGTKEEFWWLRDGAKITVQIKRVWA